MSEIEELKQQRKELDRKIRELETQQISSGEARLAFRHYSGSRPDDWLVQYHVKYIGGGYRITNKWLTLVYLPDKKSAKSAIMSVINDLQNLLKAVEEVTL